MADLKAGLASQAKIWWRNTTSMPPFLEAGGRYLSLAEEFQVTADALAELSRTGKWPDTVRVARVDGPIESPDDHGPALGEASVASIAGAAAALDGPLHDQTWKPAPVNAVPSRVKFGPYDLNAGQFMRLMADAILADSPTSSVKLKMTEMFSVASSVVPKNRLEIEQGAGWTYKPAPLTQAPATQSHP